MVGNRRILAIENGWDLNSNSLRKEVDLAYLEGTKSYIQSTFDTIHNMGRPAIPQETETQLLVGSRRRCCICYGLEHDDKSKSGQIAHLDHNPSNNNISNLAYLCLEHHDLYDSKTSQSKKLTINEVKAFKQELESHNQEIRSKSLKGVSQSGYDIYSGKYSTGDDFSGASLQITYLGGNVIKVYGIALYGKTYERGPNIGELDFVTEVNINKATFTDQHSENQYELELTFVGKKIIAKENRIVGYFGHNASFEGEYVRIN